MAVGRTTVFTLSAALWIAGTPAALAQTVTTLYDFSGKVLGANPSGVVLRDGKLYGTAALAGPRPGRCPDEGCGTVFRYNLGTGAYHVLYKFTGHGDGEFPDTGLIEHNGVLYGSTNFGGTPGSTLGHGTVFAIDLATEEYRQLTRFHGGEDGEVPGQLTTYGGKLYGATYNGGGSTVVDCGNGPFSGCGTLFVIDPTTGERHTLHRFQYTDGAFPSGPIVAFGGALYGTTVVGGAATEGTIFRFDLASGTLTTLYAFPSTHAHGTGLIAVGDALYGATDYSYSYPYCGSLFAFRPGAPTVAIDYVYVSTTPTVACYPYATVARDGKLYGVTGGPPDIYVAPAVFSFDLATHALTPLATFPPSIPPSYSGGPVAAVLADGTVLGASYFGPDGSRDGFLWALRP